MLLPADFDAGLMGLIVSPLCDKFLTYSSYDMPDYDKFYDQRALIMRYSIQKGSGLKAIKYKKSFIFKLWSIMETKWLNKTSIALKLYNDTRSSETKFAYFKVKID